MFMWTGCSRGISTGYCNRLHNFSVNVIRCYKDVSDVITVSFLEQLDPGILFLPYDFNLNWFHSRVKKLSVIFGFCPISFPIWFSSFLFPICLVTSCHLVAVQSYVEWITIKYIKTVRQICLLRNSSNHIFFLLCDLLIVFFITAEPMRGL